MCIIWRKNMYLIFYSIILYFENQSKTICFASKIKYHNSCRLIHVSRGRSALCSNPLMFSHFPDVEAEVLMAASKAHLTYPVSLWPCAPLCYSSLTLLQPPSFSSDVSGKVHLTALAPQLFLPGMFCPRWPPGSFLYVCSTVTFSGVARPATPKNHSPSNSPTFILFFFPIAPITLTYYIINLLSVYFICLLMRMLAPNICGDFLFACLFPFCFLSSTKNSIWYALGAQ